MKNLQIQPKFSKVSVFSLRIALPALGLLLGGCGSVALGPSFNDYSATYADTQNRQMLLNLARLHERHPIYFFQLGQITASYTFTGTAGLTHATAPPNPPGPFTVDTNGLSLGTTLTHNPIFNFVPLSGSSFAQELLTPISSDVFTELFQEGWPVDLLMRALIERLEVDDNGIHYVYENEPKEVTSINYDRFLVACSLARDLQQHGELRLESKNEFQALAKGLVYKDDPTPYQLVEAEKNNLAWNKLPTGGWQLGRMVKQKVFEIDTKEPWVKNRIGSMKGKAPFDTNEREAGLDVFLDVMGNGFVVKDSDSIEHGGSTLLVMRSLMGAMAAMASEQDAWEDLAKNADFERSILQDQNHPALRLTWPDRSMPDDPLITVKYHNQWFAIGDPKPGTTDSFESKTWNRDVFFLLIQLSYQVTTNPSSLATPSVIQIH